MILGRGVNRGFEEGRELENLFGSLMTSPCCHVFFRFLIVMFISYNPYLSFHEPSAATFFFPVTGRGGLLSLSLWI